MRSILALALWLAQLVGPAVGLLYIQAKRVHDIPLGPQAITILVVCLLWCSACLLSVFLRSSRQWIVAHLSRLLITAGAAVFALILAEVVLTVGDVALDSVACRPHTLSWWAFVPEAPDLDPSMVHDPVTGLRFNSALCDETFNRQGFRDRDDFGRVRRGATARVLLLGDSFAWGSAAVNDGSETGFADLLERRLKRELSVGAVLWNTAIPGIGQKQQLLHLQEFFPVLKPQVVVLAFCVGNDFTDNLYPVDHPCVFEDGIWTYRYVLERGRCRRLSTQESWLKAHQYPYEAGPAFACLRTVSLVYRQFPGEPPPTHVNGLGPTRALLADITDYVRQRGAELFVLVIPTFETVQLRGDKPEHAATLKLLGELALAHLDPLPHLTEADYTAAPDGHWSKTGHQKIADLLFEPVVRGLKRSPAAPR